MNPLIIYGGIKKNSHPSKQLRGRGEFVIKRDAIELQLQKTFGIEPRVFSLIVGLNVFHHLRTQPLTSQKVHRGETCRANAEERESSSNVYTRIAPIRGPATYPGYGRYA